MRVIVLTSTSLRHHFLINTLASALDVVGVWQEAKKFAPLDLPGSDADRAVIADHFAWRDASELAYFADHASLRLAPSAVGRHVGPGGCNDPAEAAAMQALSPDVVLVFGTEILRAPVMTPFAGRIINLHLGLSPFYRGAGTNFWPLVNREPEYVGATIHYLDEGIDTGPIIAHVRPEAAADDGPHDLGNRTVIAAAEVMARVAHVHGTGPLPSHPQTRGGRLYLRKHFTADAVRALYVNFREGMMTEYLAHRDARDAAVPLVAPPVAP